MAKKKSKNTKTNTNSAPSAGGVVGPQRLNKVLAAAGLGSRREVEELIVQGRVEVNRDVVTNLACKVDPRVDKIRVDGQPIRVKRPVYYALNKPKGVLSTNYDPSGRPRVIDFVPEKERVFSVGRLDQHSEGLILLTNDGALAQRLAHPRFGVQKTYFVTVAGEISHEDLERLKKGVYLAEGIARIDGAKIRAKKKTYTELEIVLSEGKNREIRRLLARAGHKVMVLRRIAIGPLRLGKLPVGAVRPLTHDEVSALYAAANPRGKRKKKTSGGMGTSTNPLEMASVEVDSPDPTWSEWEDSSIEFEEVSTVGEIAHDEDFFSDFSIANPRLGSVIGFDDELPTKANTSGRTKRTGKAEGGKTRPRTGKGVTKARASTAKPKGRKPSATSGPRRRNKKER